MDVIMIVGDESETQGLCEQLVVAGLIVCASERAGCMTDALERGVRPIVIGIDEAAEGASELLMTARSLGVHVEPLPRSRPELAAAELLRGCAMSELRAAS